jgi:hypothetical protein
MKFLISMHINPAVMDALADEEKAAIGAGHGRFIEELKQSGELITTQALADPQQAAVVSLRAGQPVVTDGPFLEAKEYLGGFYLVDCEDKEVEQYKNNRIEADHSRLKHRLRSMRGLRTDRTARVIIAGIAFMQNLRRGHYEIAIDTPQPLRIAAAFNELALAV